MSSDFPAKAYKKFSSGLARAEGKTCFDRLSNYFSSVVEIKDSNKRRNIEDRLKSGKFFHYPCESNGPLNSTTCFENSVHFLMATRELYPASNPRLAYIDEGARGTHSTVIFHHNGELYAGDFSYKFLSPIRFKGKKIVHDEGKPIKFKSFTPISDLEVGQVIDRLRGRKGIEHYLSEGGQILMDDPFAFRPYEIFARCDGGKVSSELRFKDFSLAMNTAISRNYDLNKNEFDMSFLVYKFGNWSNLVGAQKIGWNSESAPIGKEIILNKITSLKSFRDFQEVMFLKAWGAYHNVLKFTAKRKHKSLKDSFIYLKKDRQSFFDKYMPDAYKKYLGELNFPSFVDHAKDYYIFSRSPLVVKKFSGNKNAKSWNDVKMPNKKGFFTRSVIAGLHEIASKELREHRLLDRKVLDLLKG